MQDLSSLTMDRTCALSSESTESWPPNHYFSSVQSLSRVQHFATPWTAAHQASLSITNSWSLLKLMSIESVMPSNHLILCCPLLLWPLIFPSIRVFSNESVLRIRWPKDWSFSFNINPSNEYSGLISFRMDWLDFLAVQGTLKSLLQHIERHRHRKYVWIPEVERGSGMNWEIKIDIYVHLCIKQTRSEVAQSCPTLCNPRDCNLPGSSVHGIFQARVLEWVAIFFSRGSSRPRGRTQVYYIAGRRFTV